MNGLGETFALWETRLQFSVVVPQAVGDGGLGGGRAWPPLGDLPCAISQKKILNKRINAGAMIIAQTSKIFAIVCIKCVMLFGLIFAAPLKETVVSSRLAKNFAIHSTAFLRNVPPY